MKTSNFCKAVSAMLLIFVLCGSSAHAQQAQNETVQEQDSLSRKLICGVGISGSISGAGFGFNLSPCFSISYKLSTLSFGPNMQLFKGNFSGIQCSYEYKLDTIRCCENMQVFLHSSIAYHMSAYLNSKAVGRERAFSENYSDMDVSGIENWKFKTFEYSAGAGIRKKFNHFGISASVGIGGFHTHRNPLLWTGWLQRERTIVIIQFQAGIIYDF